MTQPVRVIPPRKKGKENPARAFSTKRLLDHRLGKSPLPSLAAIVC